MNVGHQVAYHLGHVAEGLIALNEPCESVSFGLANNSVLRNLVAYKGG